MHQQYAESLNFVIMVLMIVNSTLWHLRKVNICLVAYFQHVYIPSVQIVFLLKSTKSFSTTSSGKKKLLMLDLL